VLTKQKKDGIDFRLQQSKEKMQFQYEENSRREFHHKIEKCFSKLDGMIEAIKAQPEEDNRNWLGKVLGKIVEPIVTVVEKVGDAFGSLKKPFLKVFLK